MSQSSLIQKQMEDLAVISAQLDDNRELQSQIDRRIEALGRTKAVIEAREAREQAEIDARKRNESRAKEIGDALGSSDNEKSQIASCIAGNPDICCEDDKREECGCVVCKYEYLKSKGLETAQIRLVLGL